MPSFTDFLQFQDFGFVGLGFLGASPFPVSLSLTVIALVLSYKGRGFRLILELGLPH